jgi:hypothetical protein
MEVETPALNLPSDGRIAPPAMMIATPMSSISLASNSAIAATRSTNIAAPRFSADLANATELAGGVRRRARARSEISGGFVDALSDRVRESGSYDVSCSA